MTAPTLYGKRVVLRSPKREDASARQKYGWHADIELGFGHLSETREMTAAEAREWYENVEAELSDTYWAIEVAGELAGVIFLHSLKEKDRKARLAIGLFAPSLTGQGFGTEATQLVLGHAFLTLQLHRVDLRVLAFNEMAIASYRKCGFIVEGRERDSCRIEDTWHDDLMMSVLDREYRNDI
ncbi:MAG TPA: GNAT family protein [Candidatus Nanopelagicaceae bacterium]|nr:GNAT family protein [Candidatus Nanopelagicaceae bacterium]